LVKKKLASIKDLLL